MPVRFKVLDNVKMPEIRVVWVGFAFSGPCLEGLHLAVDEVARGNLPPAGDELKDGVEGNASEGGDGNGANDGGAMRAGHAVY